MPFSACRPFFLQLPVRRFFVSLVFDPVLLKVRIVKVLLQRTSKRHRCMLQIRYWDVEHIFQLFGHSKVLEYALCLSAEVAVKTQCCGSINVRHFKVILEQIDDTLVNGLEKNKEILDHYSKCGYSEFVLEII